VFFNVTKIGYICLKIIFIFGLDGSNSLAIGARCVEFGVQICSVDTYTVCMKYCSSVKSYNLKMKRV